MSHYQTKNRVLSCDLGLKEDCFFSCIDYTNDRKLLEFQSNTIQVNSRVLGPHKMCNLVIDALRQCWEKSWFSWSGFLSYQNQPQLMHFYKMFFLTKMQKSQTYYWNLLSTGGISEHHSYNDDFARHPVPTNLKNFSSVKRLTFRWLEYKIRKRAAELSADRPLSLYETIFQFRSRRQTHTLYV